MAKLLGGTLVLLAVLVCAPAAQATDDPEEHCERSTEPETAIPACSSLIEGAQGAPLNLTAVYFSRGLAYGRAYDSDESSGRLDHAIKDFSEVIKLDPMDVDAIYNRGVAQMFAGRYELALADYDAAITLARMVTMRSNADILAGRCFVRTRLGQVRQALEDCNEAVAGAGTPAAFTVRGYVHLKRGEFDDAIRDYDELLEPDVPQRALAAVAAGDLQLGSPFYDVAYQLYGRGLAKHGKGQKTGGNIDIAAATTIEPAIASKFEHGYFKRLWRNETRADRKRREKILTIPAAVLAHDEVAARCGSSNASFAKKAIAACTSLIVAGKETSEDLAAVYFNRGYAYGVDHDFDRSALQLDRAISDFDQALLLDPTDGDAFYNRGLAHMFAGRYERALADYDAAIRLRAHGHVLANRCFVRAVLGQPQQGLADCSAALDQAHDPYAQANRGFVYLKLRRFDDAIHDYDQLLASVTYEFKGVENPPTVDRVFAYWLYGRGLAKRGKGDITGSDIDIAIANRIDPTIETKFERCEYTEMWAIEPAYRRGARLRGHP